MEKLILNTRQLIHTHHIQNNLEEFKHLSLVTPKSKEDRLTTNLSHDITITKRASQTLSHQGTHIKKKKRNSY